ncbi:MAG TPA: TMEM175 family protein [Acetobacteraceae bacterium]|nr:TMEM175 family protein [Acetobacteraceae bacterium]
MIRHIFRSGQAEADRVEAFSDGVLAIVITLLVLEITPPSAPGGEAELWRALARLLPVIGAWVVSFLFVLVFWVSHHYLFASLAKVDRGVLWLNGLFLLFISFTPFPMALQARYPGTVPAAFLLSLAMLLTASSFALLRWYASIDAGLLRPGIATRVAREAMRRSLLAPSLYLIGTLAAFVLPWVSLVIQVIVPLIFILPHRVDSEAGREP